MVKTNIMLGKITAKHPDGNVLLVTHGDFGKMVYAQYYGLDWADTLKLFHFGNSDMLELSAISQPTDTHIHRIAQHNI